MIANRYVCNICSRPLTQTFPAQQLIDGFSLRFAAGAREEIVEAEYANCGYFHFCEGCDKALKRRYANQRTSKRKEVAMSKKKPMKPKGGKGGKGC